MIFSVWAAGSGVKLSHRERPPTPGPDHAAPQPDPTHRIVVRRVVNGARAEPDVHVLEVKSLGKGGNRDIGEQHLERARLAAAHEVAL